MPFLDTNSHLTIKPYNLDIKCQSNSESYDQHGFFGTKFRGGQNFFNKIEYSGADWLVPLLRAILNLVDFLKRSVFEFCFLNGSLFLVFIWSVF